MKRLGCFVGIFCVFILFYSCVKDTGFDESLLPGKWQQGTLFEKYMIDGTGKIWDESDYVTEDEAQNFTWTLDKADLTQIHIMEIGGNVPKLYKVIELTKTSFKYKDNHGKSYDFQKME
jgi:hypothetical protein